MANVQLVASFEERREEIIESLKWQYARDEMSFEQLDAALNVMLGWDGGHLVLHTGRPISDQLERCAG